MKNPILFIIFWIITFSISAQKQAANWYFGENAGLKFNLDNNSVNVVRDGRLSTREGCASISDDRGNLLFYTDGITIWNRNHNIMVNGNGLHGDSSSTQSGIIVPNPDDSNIYYVFTVDNFIDQVNFGLNYSIVDMRLSGGLGQVTTKNVNLLLNCSEKITAVIKDCLDGSFWLLTFASVDGTIPIYNTFHAFEISGSGVNTNSVKSTFPLSISDARGYLKLSPDGKRVACANASNGMFVYDFDTTTGSVSNQKPLSLNGANNAIFPYGVEFSPDSNLLYINASNDFFDSQNPENANNPANHFAALYQFDLRQNDLQSTEIIIDERQLYRGALQLGPNGKIYRALSASYLDGLSGLSVIEEPNKIGALCNYNHNSINLSPSLSSQGLPPFIASFFNSQIDIIKNGRSQVNLELCDNDSYTLTSINIPGASYTWSRDGIPLPENTFDLEVNQAGHYEVFIDPNNGECAIEGQAFVNFNENPIGYDHTILQCDEDGINDGLTLFNLEEATVNLTGGIDSLSARFYLDQARTNLITEPDNFMNTTTIQVIYAQVFNIKTECMVDVELTLEVSVTDVLNTEIAVCDYDGLEDGIHEFNLTNANTAITTGLSTNVNISYYETYEDALLEKNNLSDVYTNTTPYNQIIFARAENNNNCYGISEVLLIVDQPPQIQTEELFYYCTNSFPQTITIDAGLNTTNYSDFIYSWSTGEQTNEIAINSAGTYTVTVTNIATGCAAERVVTVEPSGLATFAPFEVVDAAQNNTVAVNVTGDGIYQFSLINQDNGVTLPYQDSNIFDNVKPGIYTVSVKDIKNSCGIVESAVSVIGFPKFFTPNNDGQNDTWQVYGVSRMFQPDSKIMIFNRYGKLMKEISPIGEGWDGLVNGQVLPADDYWFSVELQDGRVFKDHFTLKN
ncbi:gliding motility-associated C-terminal domain-containing protein [Hyunsoonleella jejuensis]|uniref:Gliding motility-associated C-terminal domain-containing protein n=1 Tax=Hyunsoonleella jejuensis TaxID=419940 RepID=A0A1H9JJ96_9FLAO|nr:T9SS type B sorting domain-containing protein [Hyunsoonleella jejuensis]SEQ86890.1 gliding motility-associated C-terminal domain-containing protein [Hyunsoonleella jejuensis]